MKRRPVALVTGAARGVGRAVAVALGEEGGPVAVHVRRAGREAEGTARLVRRAGGTADVFAADLADEGEARGLIRRVEQAYGRVDILVNCVGPILVKPWDSLAASDWEALFRTNLLSAYYCLTAALPGMKRRRWGRVVNLGFHRVEQRAAFPTILPYAAAKAGLLLLTRTAEAAAAPFGVTVNMVSPGVLKGGIRPSGPRVRPGDVGRTADVAAAVRFLVSEEAAGTTGSNVLVAGTWKM
jgi:3-oxoacyl-[acyl-carrier protein] reductase